MEAYIFRPQYFRSILSRQCFRIHSGSDRLPVFRWLQESKTDVFSGNSHKYYTFNITRYVQRIVTQHTRVYDMRLYAPFNINYPQYSGAYIPYGNNVAFGRVKIGSGSQPQLQAQASHSLF